jgi:hypothetical protein
MNSSGRNMYVFRDGSRLVLGATLVDSLATGIQRLSSVHSLLGPQAGNALVDALLRSGELECALADAGSPEASRLALLSDLLANLLVAAPCSHPTAEEMIRLLPREAPTLLQLSPPEGFAYYALHPLDFADLAAATAVESGHAAVIGIRSIGTTLGAVVAAALLKRGLRVARITVRPTGHPYDRQTALSASQMQWIAQQRAQEAEFIVVDEGPGMSGSSFLSVGEALLGAGVARSRIQFLCSRHPEVTSLCARDAAARWNSFRSAATRSASHLPADAKIYVGGGYWRHELIGYDPARWPVSWSQMERVKFLSPDRSVLFKFEGLGRFGDEIRRRAQILCDSGYAVAPREFIDGFGSYPFVPGAILTPPAVCGNVLERMAGYCAFRRSTFHSWEAQNAEQMETMLRFNVEQEFGVELNGGLEPLETADPVVVDGRMLPHEWIQAHDGRLLKCDGASHGDDHFFPGPATDICWDLAGAIIEWRLAKDASDYFIARYHAFSGDDPRRRLPSFLLAYAVFRLAYCKMAAAAMRGSDEEQRLLSAYGYYRECAGALLPRHELLET